MSFFIICGDGDGFRIDRHYAGIECYFIIIQHGFGRCGDGVTLLNDSLAADAFHLQIQQIPDSFLSVAVLQSVRIDAGSQLVILIAVELGLVIRFYLQCRLGDREGTLVIRYIIVV